MILRLGGEFEGLNTACGITPAHAHYPEGTVEYIVAPARCYRRRSR